MKIAGAVSVGLMAVGVGLVLLYGTPQVPEPQVVLAKPPSSQGQIPEPHSRPASQLPVARHGHGLPSSEPKRPQGRFSAADFADLFTAQDPYPALLALSRSGRPGAFVAIFEFRRICLRAVDTARRSQHRLPFDSNDSDFALRQAAWEQLQRRCGPFFEQRDGNQLDPLPSDAHAQALVNFFRTDPIGADGRIASIEKLERDVQAMLDQGYISAVSGLHGRILAHSKRRAWDLSDVDRSVAFQLATLRSQSLGARATQDLRMQMHCALFGYCGDSFDALLNGVSGERRERIQAAAALMENAIRAGDLNALLGPPIAKPGVASPPN